MVKAEIKKKIRNSNLELYRIIVMLLIIAHHYVVNSGLINMITSYPTWSSAIPLLLFGAWGKTGINCFMLITGYFMCKTQYTVHKLLKLYLQILFYTVIIYGIFLISGHEVFSIKRLIQVVIPIFDLSSNNFVGCFIVFYLFIPFLNILINSLFEKDHKILIILAIVCYSVLPTISVKFPINYIGWFSVLYLIASYIRIYGFPINISHKKWGIITVIAVLISSLSVVTLMICYLKRLLPSVHVVYFFISDSNKMLALIVGVSSFMYFKDLKIPYSRFINILGATTFGVLLIHSNSDAMRNWLWKEIFDCEGHFGNDIMFTLCYAALSVVIVFVGCAGIDWFRVTYVEPRLISSTEFILQRPMHWLKTKFQNL